MFYKLFSISSKNIFPVRRKVQNFEIYCRWKYETTDRFYCKCKKNNYFSVGQIDKGRVESQPIVTIEATLQLTIPALIKSSTKDL